jgi:hypothetical protein
VGAVIVVGGVIGYNLIDERQKSRAMRETS